MVVENFFFFICSKKSQRKSFTGKLYKTLNHFHLFNLIIERFKICLKFRRRLGKWLNVEKNKHNWTSRNCTWKILFTPYRGSSHSPKHSLVMDSRRSSLVYGCEKILFLPVTAHCRHIFCRSPRRIETTSKGGYNIINLIIKIFSREIQYNNCRCENIDNKMRAF